jgi:pimeloyl-ACP methyl ester carboxylesterase
MGTSARWALVQEAPHLVGNLEGVPFAMRDVANRTLLKSTMEQLVETIDTAEGRLVIEQARRQLHTLEEVQRALGSSKALPPRNLLTLDLAGSGRAAIVVGDLRTADYVSYLIPGMFFTVEGQIGDWTDVAAQLYEDQVSWLKLLGTEEEKNQSVATIAWLGYETPNLTNVGGLENAHEGRDLIAQAVEGLQSIRKGDEPYVSLLAHSYGSTAALMALTEYDFEVDALAMVGSPGSDAQSVRELNVRNGNVYVGEASWDPVPNSAFFGSDPGSESYGAKPMGVGGGFDVVTHEWLAGSTGHIEYFGPNTESMRNLALIGIDKGEFVSNGLAANQVKAVGSSK